MSTNMKAVKFINMGGYREWKARYYITKTYGDCVEIDDVHITDSVDIDHLISKGYKVILGIGDLYNELANLDSINDVEYPEFDADTLRIIKNWDTLAKLCIKHMDNDNVEIININKLYDFTSKLHFDYPKWYYYSDYSKYFGYIFDDNASLYFRNLELFGPLFNKSLLPATYNTSLDHIGYNASRVIICVQDIECDVVSYVRNIIGVYGDTSLYFIYDLTSSDNTYFELIPVEFKNTNITIKLLNESILEEALATATILTESYNANDTHSNIALFIKTRLEDFVDYNFKTIVPREFVHELESFSISVDNESKLNCAILIKSIRLLYDLPIFIRCDLECEEFIKNQSFTGIYYNEIDVLNRFEVINDALVYNHNTIYIDSDIILLNKIVIDGDYDLIVAPYYNPVDTCDTHGVFGHFNGRYVFVSNSDIPNTWNEILNDKSDDSDVNGLDRLVGVYKSSTFSVEHAVGHYRDVNMLGNIFDDEIISIRYDSTCSLDFPLNIISKYLYENHLELFTYINVMLAPHTIRTKFGTTHDVDYTYILMSKVNVGMFSSKREFRLGHHREHNTDDLPVDDYSPVHARIRDIPTEEYLIYKFQLFKDVCHKSVTTQTDLDFTWILYCDENTPESWKVKFREFEQDTAPKIKIYWTSEDFLLSPETFTNTIRSEISCDDNVAVTSIIDIDDGMSKDFIESMKTYIVTPDTTIGHYLIAPNHRYGLVVGDDGLYTGWINDIFREPVIPVYQFIMLVELLDKTDQHYSIKSAFHVPHERMPLAIDNNVIIVEYPYPLQSMNNYSIYNGDVSTEIVYPIDNLECSNIFNISSKIIL